MPEHMKLMDTHVKSWDRDYRNRGRLWGGSAKSLPRLPKGSAVLELGCGNGKTLMSMKAEGMILGLDMSPSALRLCRSASIYAELILADARRLPFKDESFNFIFAFHVIGHMLLPEREAISREAARVLVRGGRIFFRDFSGEDMRAGKGKETERGTFQRGEGILTHYFTEIEAKTLFGILETESISTHRWKQRVRGQELTRAEVEATFLKN